MILLKKELSVSIVIRAIKILPLSDRIKLIILGFSQVLLSLLDVIGVAIIGIIGSLSVSGSVSSSPGGRVETALNYLNIDEFPIQKQVGILGIAAAIALVSKTLFSIYFSRKTLFFLSIRTANLTRSLISKLLSLSLQEIQKKSIQENVYMLTGGVGNITTGVLGTTASLLADISLVLVLIVGLFFVDPLVAVMTIAIFGGILLVLYFGLHKTASNLGEKGVDLGNRSTELIQEVLRSYREAVVGAKRSFYVNQIGSNQLELAENNARRTFLPSISKYVLEITIVIGTLIICILQFAQNNAAHAVAVISVFFAASARIIPALLRIQQSAIFITGISKVSKPTLEMIESLGKKDNTFSESNKFDTSHIGFQGDIKLKNISLSYTEDDKLVLDNLSININSGESIAIVGKSGAGKTSLVDVLLGVVIPQNGIVTISGMSPTEAINKWPGAIAYVPQEIQIINGTIRENICLGYKLNEIPDEIIWKALRIAQAENLVTSLNNGLDTYIGDNGNKLSGGERQRIGICRAIITKPKLLVMDEATSSLDSQTEQAMSSALFELKKETTLILIAHRLSSAKNMDKLIYLDSGKIISFGTFNHVREKVSDFDIQSSLMGL